MFDSCKKFEYSIRVEILHRKLEGLTAWHNILAEIMKLMAYNNIRLLDNAHMEK